MGNLWSFSFYFVAALGTTLALLGLTIWLGPKKPSRIKQTPFECGNIPFEVVRGRFNVKFFLVAVLFILFDVELIFLFPWAVVFRRLGLFGLVEMLVFLAAVAVGLFYVWKKGALEWS